MSGICGRRRLVKLVFVTGASGNLRGFLEEVKDIDEPSDFRLTDPFGSLVAFLQVPSEIDDASAPGGSLHSGFLQSGIHPFGDRLRRARSDMQLMDDLIALERVGAEADFEEAAEGYLLTWLDAVMQYDYPADLRTRQFNAWLDELAQKGDAEQKIDLITEWRDHEKKKKEEAWQKVHERSKGASELLEEPRRRDTINNPIYNFMRKVGLSSGLAAASKKSREISSLVRDVIGDPTARQDQIRQDQDQFRRELRKRLAERFAERKQGGKLFPLGFVVKNYLL